MRQLCDAVSVQCGISVQRRILSLARWNSWPVRSPRARIPKSFANWSAARLTAHDAIGSAAPSRHLRILSKLTTAPRLPVRLR